MSEQSDLQYRQATYLPFIDQEMRAVFQAAGRSPDAFLGMMHYHMGWVDAGFAPHITYTGKQIRPLLALLCCEAAGGQWTQALPAAAAIEILHNFSLVHDDIEDGSPTRRGRPTVWQLWGQPQAINTGDAMFATAQLCLTYLAERGVAADIIVTALRRFNETCLALTRGQWADMSFEQRDDVSVEEYIAMINGKTAVLIALACELGARIANAPTAIVHHYAQFGRDLGLAFQVIDDILGIWGDEAAIGKSAESDILTKKKSLPVLYGLTHNAALRAHYALPATTDGFVPRAIELLDAVGTRDYSEQIAARYSQSAVDHLNAARPQGAAGGALHELTALLLQRNS